MDRPGAGSFAALVLAALVAGPSAAAADPPVPAPRPRPPGVVLGRGQLSLTLNLEVQMSAGKAGEPVSLAPDLAYGVTDDLTVTVVHSLSAMTGLRAAAGGGLCLTGTDGGCVALYNNVGAEGWYRIARGALPAALVVGVHATNLDAGFHAAKLGLRLRYPRGRFILQAWPSVLVALTHRTDAAGDPLDKDTLWLPVLATVKLDPRLTLGVGSALKGPLQGFADGWTVPLLFVAQTTINRQLTAGAAWGFGSMLGGDAVKVTGTDIRGLQLWLTFTR